MSYSLILINLTNLTRWWMFPYIRHHFFSPLPKTSSRQKKEAVATLPVDSLYFLLNVFIVISAPTVAKERIASPKIFNLSGIALRSSSLHSPKT